MPDHAAAITLRRATLDDIPLLVSFRAAFVAEVSPDARVPELDANVEAYLRRHMPDGSCVNWLPFDGAEAVGTGCLGFYELLPNAGHPDSRRAYILNMYTRPSHRRQGIAQAILDRLVDEVRRAGLKDVTLHALPAGERVYLDYGFVRTHDEMAYTFR